jgi:dynein heavy chain
MMFEVEDLAVASPATVSRCGMVYMEPESLTLKPLIQSWMATLPPKVAASKYIVQTLTDLWNDMLEEGCYFMRKNCPELVKTVDNNLAQSCMRLIDCYLKKYIETEVKKITADQIEQLSQQIKSIFMFSFLWSVGGTTDLIGRGRFDKWLRERMAKHSIAFPEDK